MEKVNNIVFDFGGVLLDWNPRYLYQTYFKEREEMEFFLSNICTDAWNAEQDGGRLFEDGIRELVAAYPDYKEAIGLFWDKWECMLKGELTESVRLLKQLKDFGYGIYGLTNWSAETIGVAYSRYDFFKLFDGIVVSGEEGVIKPNPRIYEILLSRYGLSAESTLFIDDNPANIEAARRLNFKTVLFDNIDSVRSQVSDILGKKLINI